MQAAIKQMTEEERLGEMRGLNEGYEGRGGDVAAREDVLEWRMERKGLHG